MENFQVVIDRYKAKLDATKIIQVQNSEIVEELTKKAFNDEFAGLFYELAERINKEVGAKVLSYIIETKDRFVLQGQHHRIFFQKGKTEVYDKIATVNIVPIYIWKGVTKHLGPITIVINSETREIKWDIISGCIEDYAIKIFNNLIDDKDFSM